MADYGIKKNKEGYADPTAYKAMRSIIQEENEQQRRVSELVGVLKFIIDKAGYDIIARIELRDRNTGKEYR